MPITCFEIIKIKGLKILRMTVHNLFYDVLMLIQVIHTKDITI